MLKNCNDQSHDKSILLQSIYTVIKQVKWNSITPLDRVDQEDPVVYMEVPMV